MAYSTASCEDFHTGTFAVLNTVAKKNTVIAANNAPGGASDQNRTWMNCTVRNDVPGTKTLLSAARKL